MVGANIVIDKISNELIPKILFRAALIVFIGRFRFMAGRILGSLLK